MGELPGPLIAVELGGLGLGGIRRGPEGDKDAECGLNVNDVAGAGLPFAGAGLLKSLMGVF